MAGTETTARALTGSADSGAADDTGVSTVVHNPCTDHEIRAAWAAGLWTRAFDAKKASLAGADPDAALTRTEAAQRCQLAGL